MKKVNVLLSNNVEKDPFLYSQLLDIYKDLDYFDKEYVFCDGTSKLELYKATVISNAATKKSSVRYLIYYYNLLRLLYVNRKNELSIHVRGFVSGVLFYFVPKILFKSIKYIYDPRGAFLAERMELGNNPLLKVLITIEKKLIANSIKTIVTTEKFKELFISNYGYPNNYLVCYNSSSFKPLNNEIELDSLSVVNVCYCGSVNHWHNLDEIARVMKHVYDLYPTKAKIYFFTNVKNKHEIQNKLSSIPKDSLIIDFIPYNELETALSKMHICISVVKPAVSTIIASPIKVSDYILQNKHIILNDGIGDFDDHYFINNSALLYKYGEKLNFTAENLNKLKPYKNLDLREKICLKTNQNKIFKYLLNQ